MSTYKLKLRIEEWDVQFINLNQLKLILVKPPNPLVWLCVSPFENNEFVWTNTIGLYASNTEIEVGARIVKGSDRNPAFAQYYYPFQNDIFSEPRKLDESFRDKYQIKNESSHDLTFGLTQEIAFNGNKPDANPINAVTVLKSQTATFSNSETVVLYFSANKDNGAVISQIDSEAIELDFTDSKNSEQCIIYKNGRFIQQKY